MTDTTAAKSAEDGRPRIAIVGGGLGGITLAIGLLAQPQPLPFTFTIYESAKTFGEIGAGVAFGENAVKALYYTSPELLAAFKKHATFNGSPERQDAWIIVMLGENLRNGSGKMRNDFAFCLERPPSEVTGLPPRSCVHRARFLDEIVKMIPNVPTEFDKHLESIEDAKDGTYRLHFRDGTVVTADAVIGCDGIKSKVREHLYGDKIQPKFAEMFFYRAMVPIEEFEKVMGRDLSVNGVIWAGYDGYGITYPVEHGKLVNMAIGFRTSDLSWPHEAWIFRSTVDEMSKITAGLHPGIRELLQKYSTGEKWATFDLQHPEPMYRGRIALLGDSAHATTPHLGAGAGQAMEDAYILSNLLGSIRSNQDIEKAFGAYNGVRRERSQMVVSSSRESGRVMCFRSPECGDDLERMRLKQTRLYKEIWDGDLKAMHSEALRMMQSSRS